MKPAGSHAPEAARSERGAPGTAETTDEVAALLLAAAAEHERLGRPELARSHVERAHGLLRACGEHRPVTPR